MTFFKDKDVESLDEKVVLAQDFYNQALYLKKRFFKKFKKKGLLTPYDIKKSLLIFNKDQDDNLFTFLSGQYWLGVDKRGIIVSYIENYSLCFKQVSKVSDLGFIPFPRLEATYKLISSPEYIEKLEQRLR